MHQKFNKCLGIRSSGYDTDTLTDQSKYHEVRAHGPETAYHPGRTKCICITRYTHEYSGTGNTGGTGTTQKTDGTGKGIIANTYAGVNVRSGAGIANAIVRKIRNGTEVTILEVKLVGAAKWGRVKQGWICMDYVS